MQKTVYLVAGQNGVGKSTFSTGFDDTIPVIDPDIDQSLSLLEQGRATLRRFGALSDQGQTFVYETTLSGRTGLKRLRNLKSRGYAVHAYFISVQGIHLSRTRVAFRTKDGGHDVPTEDQIRRFERTWRNSVELTQIADFVVFLDNSTKPGHVPYAAFRRGVEFWIAKDAPRWIERTFEQLAFQNELRLDAPPDYVPKAGV